MINEGYGILAYEYKRAHIKGHPEYPIYDDNEILGFVARASGSFITTAADIDNYKVRSFKTIEAAEKAIEKYRKNPTFHKASLDYVGSIVRTGFRFEVKSFQDEVITWYKYGGYQKHSVI